MKIVSLCPSITETLIDFGLSDRLVGITRYCIHPEEIVRNLTQVGGTKDPDVEAIRALSPDLVFMNGEENRREDFEALAQEFVVDVSEPRHVAEVPAVLRHFGAITRCSGIANARAEALEQELSELKPSAFTFCYLIWRKPWMCVGGDTYVSDLFSHAGGKNVFAGSDRYPTIELSQIRDAKPDCVFLADEPFPFQEKHRIEVQEVVDRPVRLISGDDCCWHGVRSIRGVKLMKAVARSFDRLNE